MTAPVSATAAALRDFAPELEARFIKFTTATIARYVEKFGPDLRGIANSGSYTAWQNGCAAFYSRQTHQIDEAALARYAAEYATATIESWAAKIDAKLGELDDATLIRGAGATFTLRGRKAGRNVTIEQDMIVNVSSKGTLFNQFPARIYVDGKFTPAAKFAAL